MFGAYLALCFVVLSIAAGVWILMNSGKGE